MKRTTLVRPGMHLIAALLVGACGGDDDASRTFDFSAFEAEIEEFIGEEDSVDGAGVILVHRDDGVIFHKSFGTFTNDRISLIASSSKSITAGVLLKLSEQGLLDMDEPIVEQVGWDGNNPRITPAQLVSNSSGLVGLSPDPTFGPYLCQYLWQGTIQDCAETIFTTELDDENARPGLAVVEPDTEFRYGGAQWQVAGGVAEIVSGKSWGDLVRETFTEPCELEALEYNNHFTQLFSDSGNPFSYPSGFDSDPSNLAHSDNPNMEGGAYITTGDYGKLLLMQLRGGRCGDNQVLSEESVLRMRTDRIGPAYGGDTGFGVGGYGLGWWVIGDRLVTDPGAYGAYPWIDDARNYAGYIVSEATSAISQELFDRTFELVNEEIDRHFGRPRGLDR